MAKTFGEFRKSFGAARRFPFEMSFRPRATLLPN